VAERRRGERGRRPLLGWYPRTQHQTAIRCWPSKLKIINWSGRGRTGMVISTYLLREGFFRDAKVSTSSLLLSSSSPPVNLTTLVSYAVSRRRLSSLQRRDRPRPPEC
jgi:hypothetical protein